MIPKLNPTLFDATTWRNGTPLDLFGVQLRTWSLANIKTIALKYAVGYCDGGSLMCRPNAECKAVMFYKDDQYIWFHLLNSEFEYIFRNP